MGGTSDERDVSLSSGVGIARALREAGHEAIAVDTARGVMSGEEERRLLAEGVRIAPPSAEELGRLDESGIVSLTRDPHLAGTDVYFVGLHGGTGEDGTVQALLDVAGVTYTGSDRLGCSLAMDKEVSKRLFREAGIPTPDWLAAPAGGPVPTVIEVERKLGLPVIVKAAAGGSSLRLLLAHDRAELEHALEASRSWGGLVLFERYHKGRELTVGIVGREALPVGEIIPAHELFDYECKYQPGMAEEIFPAEISSDLEQRVQRLALRAHEALRLRDCSRVDFIVDQEGVPWCLEANALPGMTPNSLVPKAARAAGMDFPALCDCIVGLARSRQAAHSTG
jgi:D-alanine-D-alanine ligase